MLMSRILLAIPVAGMCALGAAGVLTLSPGAVAGTLIVGALIGVTVFALANEGPWRRHQWQVPRLLGLVTGATVAVGGLMLAGLIALLGPATAFLIVLLLVPAAAWLGRRPLGRWWSGHFDVDDKPGNSDTLADMAVRKPELPAVEGLSTPELCQQWRRSFVALQRASDSQAWHRVIVARGCYLDELERRDPEGFSRWLDTGARAGSDPNRFLTRDS